MKPDDYKQLSDEQLTERIAAAKKKLGNDLVILGHHYQRDEVIQFADFIGDSLKLSQQAAAQKHARFIVFCGVHFMAESADILSGPEQVVCLPNMQAGCSMAAMADEPAVQDAIDDLAEMSRAKIIPVTYVNSTAAIKAITARAGGACCTSSNARNVFEWALRSAQSGGAGGQKVLAIPDQHLARNTAIAMGLTADQVVVYDPAVAGGGLDAEAVERAKFIVWKGHCYVHARFAPQNVKAVREAHPGIRVIVHPECPREVVELADAAGSTEQIIRAVAEAPAGSSWAIGTESSMVHRLAAQHPDKMIRILGDVPSFCVQMQQIDLPHLAWCLESLAAGEVVNRISVAPDIAADARVALERMIAIPGATGITPGKTAGSA
jgi:quinolinate synthase